MSADAWENPLTGRYASTEMSALFSARHKFATWRKLWLWLAEAEQELGLAIPDAALDALRAHLVPTDGELAAATVEQAAEAIPVRHRRRRSSNRPPSRVSGPGVACVV